MEGNNWGKEN